MPRSTRASAARANAALTNGADQLSSPPATPAPGKKGRKATPQTKAPEANESRMRGPPVTPASSTRKRSRKAIKQEDGYVNDGDVNELPHNLGAALQTPGADTYPGLDESRPHKRQRTARKTEADGEPAIKGEDVEQLSEGKKTPKKANYGLTPGTSPYPDYPRPTHDECREVVRLLEKVHGKAIAPKAIPPPSLNVSGCGEVPSVLDALVRTRLSANTTNKNSSTAFQGLVARFGTLKEGIGKGSVDWNAVRRAPQKEVFRAIERGGLADRKSKDIQAILQMAYEENQERKAALTCDANSPAGAEKERESEKREEVAKAAQNVISLDHIHLLSTDDAISKMLTYPGIGPKTASCVALFCLQRPSFAVDTHVFRLCQYLGWVPKITRKGQPKVDRNTTYSHCDVRIPDDLKYPLHQLLIKHGKTCPRCRAATGQTSANWEEGCPIEHLVKRHGAKKGGISTTERRKAEAAAGLAGDDADEGGADGKEVESELSDVPEGGDVEEGAA